MSDELAIVEQSTITSNSVSIVKDNNTIESENKEALLIINTVLKNKDNIVKINGKRHIEFEDWIALGNAYGVSVATYDAEPVEIFEARGFKAHAKVIRMDDGTVVGSAEAYCLDNEKNWKNRDYFQMASMAQTRAGSKALSNVLRFITALDKSLSGTPAEEIESRPKPKPKAKPKAKPKNKPQPKPEHEPEIVVDAEIIETKKENNNADEVETLFDNIEPEKPRRNLKEIIDENPKIQEAVDRLKEDNLPINRTNISEKLLDMVEHGGLKKSEYKELKPVIEN